MEACRNGSIAFDPHLTGGPRASACRLVLRELPEATKHWAGHIALTQIQQDAHMGYPTADGYSNWMIV